jgi:predicted aspartyl protease
MSRASYLRPWRATWVVSITSLIIQTGRYSRVAPLIRRSSCGTIRLILFSKLCRDTSTRFHLSNFFHQVATSLFPAREIRPSSSGTQPPGTASRRLVRDTRTGSGS